MKDTRNVNHRTLVKQNENETSAAAIFSAASIGDLFDRQAMAKVNISRCLGMGHIKITAIFKGSLGGETSVLRTFRMSGKELVKERVSKERVRQGKS